MLGISADELSVLFNEPKLLKCYLTAILIPQPFPFSALQRAEIAEITCHTVPHQLLTAFSALQRAEIAEICQIPFG